MACTPSPKMAENRSTKVEKTQRSAPSYYENNQNVHRRQHPKLVTHREILCFHITLHPEARQRWFMAISRFKRMGSMPEGRRSRWRKIGARRICTTFGCHRVFIAHSPFRRVATSRLQSPHSVALPRGTARSFVWFRSRPSLNQTRAARASADASLVVRKAISFRGRPTSRLSATFPAALAPQSGARLRSCRLGLR